MRLLSEQIAGERITVSFGFSDLMDCNSITNSLSVNSIARDNQRAQLDTSTVACGPIENVQSPDWEGAASSVYNYSITLSNVHHGIHDIVLNNATSSDWKRHTNVCARSLLHPFK